MSDAHIEKPTKQGRGRAFHSRLEPFVEYIREQRHRRRTWKEIAGLLHTEKGCPLTFQGVHQFYRRFLKRQARPHWESEGAVTSEAPPAEPSRKAVLAALPPARSFKAPNPDSIKLNDPTHV